MSVTVTHFVLLYVLNQTLFISVPSPIAECYVTIDNGTKNETWPANWSRMEPTSITFNRLCKINLNEKSPILNAKFRLFFEDHSYITTDWQQILMDSISINNDILLWETTAFSFLFIVICLTFLLIYKLVRGEKRYRMD